ncbi:outer membrane beta-barrel protein [Herminiimonas contaminans]|uniref:Outer membrane beta-barrel protein n=1 Tax=Herminiimonas contaminans TaxID=1111140 RepID=A0ABS0EXR7_9BURK|nr:outer membrane beta-barrel protein [Herminiimonas contaminans]MBF8177943.1 outer membrane beta-barrel protein [Herminiimonas contaminans]
MNKKLGMAVLGAAFILPFTAQAEGAYVGFNGGRAQQKLNIYEDGSSGKDSATAYKFYGGYEFNQYFGVQGGYVDMGKARGSYEDDGVKGTLQSKIKSLYVAVIGSLPVNQQFSLFGKLGVSRNRVKLMDNWVEDGVAWRAWGSETRTKPLIGVGAEYKFTKNWAMVAEYEDFGKVLKGEGANLKARMYSVGLHYHF